MANFCLSLKRSQKRKHSRHSRHMATNRYLGTRTHEARGPPEMPHGGADQVWRWEWRRSRLGPSCRSKCSTEKRMFVCVCHECGAAHAGSLWDSWAVKTNRELRLANIMLNIAPSAAEGANELIDPKKRSSCPVWDAPIPNPFLFRGNKSASDHYFPASVR